MLGALMLDKDAISVVLDILQPESFYTEGHQAIYRAMLTLFDKNSAVDLLTVREQLLKSGELDKAGGPYRLVQLSNRVGSAANVEYHARIIAQKSIARDLIKASSEVLRDAYDDDDRRVRPPGRGREEDLQDHGGQAQPRRRVHRRARAEGPQAPRGDQGQEQ